ncbi:hypothetical protein F2Q68_00003062 [Brassica cretica]|uniref:Uncharacterized protein n=1 Tax=Brassica cretica TaxID=69181 RepID=A0A8S9JCC7_BRACR|nr:hypothetical protein F2Q68_00003062 [Brassica cretica]
MANRSTNTTAKVLSALFFNQILPGSGESKFLLMIDEEVRVDCLQKETRGLDTPPTSPKLPLGLPPESHRNHEPSPEVNDIKSSPDHSNHLTTRKTPELTTTTENHLQQLPPYTTTKRDTARGLMIERCDAESESGCSSPTERENTEGRGRTTRDICDAGVKIQNTTGEDKKIHLILFPL